MSKLQEKRTELVKIRRRMNTKAVDDKMKKLLKIREERVREEIQELKGEEKKSVKKKREKTYKLEEIQEMIKYGWNKKIRLEGWDLLAKLNSKEEDKMLGVA